MYMYVSFLNVMSVWTRKEYQKTNFWILVINLVLLQYALWEE